MEIERFLHQRIPVSKAMGIRVEGCDGRKVVIRAPLEVNHNHLGTAFGGSLAAVATLAGYLALWTALGDREAHVVVRRSEIDYLRPVEGEIVAVCEVPSEASLGSLRRAFAARGKGRLTLKVVISASGQTAVRFEGDYVAMK